MTYKEIADKVNGFRTEYEDGYTSTDIDRLIQELPPMNIDRFNEALLCNTGRVIDDKFITYHCDIEKAVRCGLENRNLKMYEFD